MKLAEHIHTPYSLGRKEKDQILTGKLTELSAYHRRLCPEYDRMLSALGTDLEKITDYRQLPPLPVGLFKKMRLSSLKEGSQPDMPGELKVLTSSGTTGQIVSQVVLDGETRNAQQKALAEIGVDFLGEQRLPMLVIDCESTVINREKFSARTAAIQGFSLFGVHRTFALREDMSLDIDKVRGFLEQYGGQPFLIFGFTFIIWEYLVCADGPVDPARLAYSEHINDHGHDHDYHADDYNVDTDKGIAKQLPDLSNGILIHGGGWKKLADLNISEEQFRSTLFELFGLVRVHDYYGMAEQAGSIFMECEEGHLHCSDYSGVVIRRGDDFSICENGEPGVIEVCSIIPKSYPGHILLTEDEGVMLGEDDCPCGRKGAYFKVIGRIKHAELRGCSDTYEKI